MVESLSEALRARPRIAAALLVTATATGVWLLARTPGLFDPWYLTRATGLVAMVLLWASVLMGLLQSTGYLQGFTSGLANAEVHTFVSVAAVYTTGYHMAILLWDRYIGFGALDLLVPFASHYKPLLLGLGTLAFYAMIAVTVTTYYRARLGARCWRIIHQLGVVGFLLALAHGFFAGTDSRLTAVRALYWFAALTVLLLLVYRLLKGVWSRAGAVGGRR